MKILGLAKGASEASPVARGPKFFWAERRETREIEALESLCEREPARESVHAGARGPPKGGRAGGWGTTCVHAGQCARGKWLKGLLLPF